MTEPSAEAIARNRYYLMMLANLVLVAGAVFGLYLMGRATAMPPRLIGAGIVIAALYAMAVVPRGMARRWRTPRDE